MKACNRYELDGEILEIPLRWDQRTQAYVEDYGDYIDQPAYTPAGRPILAGACGGPAGPSNRAFAVPKFDFL